MQTSTSKKKKKKNLLMAFFTLSKTKVFELIKKIFIHLNANKYFLKKNTY
jgi:hypothetical protein